MKTPTGSEWIVGSWIYNPGKASSHLNGPTVELQHSALFSGCLYQSPANLQATYHSKKFIKTFTDSF